METQARPKPCAPFSPVSSPSFAPIRHLCQLRPSYDHSTNSTLLRFKTLFPATESVELSNPEKPPSPFIRPGGQNACGSTQIVSISATALAVLAELSDTKKPFSATRSLPLPRFVPSTWPKLDPMSSLPSTPIRGPGFPWLKPPEGPRQKCHSVTFLQLRKCHKCLNSKNL